MWQGSVYRLVAALTDGICSAQVWSVERAKGKMMTSGGTLVIGREQDCLGGCFDSNPGEVHFWLTIR